MPSFVPHSDKAPYKAMTRFENGPSGNPHYHGFSMGVRGPRMNRVRADVEGVGDEPLDVDADIRDILDHVFGADDNCGAEITGSIVIERIRKRLQAVLSIVDAMRSGDAGSEIASPAPSFAVLMKT